MTRFARSVAALSVLGLCSIPVASLAAPLTFTYDCSIDGSAQGGLGTNRCAGGPTIAQVRISDSGFDYDNGSGPSDVLLVEARLQFFDPNPPSNGQTTGYQLDAVWLNIDELLLGNGSGNTEVTGSTGISWVDGNGSNDFNYIWFARDPGFTNGKTQIEVAAQSTDASSWKNFDLGLCSARGQSPAACALDLPVLSSLNQNPATQPWTTLGYLNSGNLYDLIPENFAFTTLNTRDPGQVNYPGPCGWQADEMASVIKIDPRATSQLFDPACLSGSGYGPRYGARFAPPAEQQVSEPGTLSLLGLSIVALVAGFRNRKPQVHLA